MLVLKPVFGIFEHLNVIFSNSFQAVAHQSPDQFQLEQITVKKLKRAFYKNYLVTFYKNYVGEQYPNLAKHALKILSLFGSTYSCKQFLPKMKHCKRERRGLSDEHLKSQLFACSSTKVNIVKAVRDVQQQKLH